MEIKLTTLSENTASGNGLAEWGFSVYVEADGQKILFDTGQGTAAIHNAHVKGIDLTKTDKIVISHGHDDHTGGLRGMLERIGKQIEIIAHPDIFSYKFSKWGDRPENYAGIPFRRELLESLGARFNLTGEPVRISDNIMTTGEVPLLNDYESVDKNLHVRENGELKHDSLADDLSLVIDTDYGLVVVLGCAHRGIINNIKQAQKVTGKDLVYAAIGGTHLLRASEERIVKTAVALQEMGVQYLGVSHCTGFRASAYLAQEFGERFFQNNAGTYLELPFK